MNGSDVFMLMFDLMLAHLPVVLSDALLVAGCVVLACRIDKMMRGVTSLRVFLQHAALAMGMFGAFLLSFTTFSAWGPVSVAAGVLVFLLLSLSRWRYAPPAGTNRAHPVRARDLRHVAGGSRSKP